jgi:hypothetical protein
MRLYLRTRRLQVVLILPVAGSASNSLSVVIVMNGSYLEDLLEPCILGGVRYKLRPGHRELWKVYLVLLSPSRRIPGYYYKLRSTRHIFATVFSALPGEKRFQISVTNDENLWLCTNSWRVFLQVNSGTFMPIFWKVQKIAYFIGCFCLRTVKFPPLGLRNIQLIPDRSVHFSSRDTISYTC